MRGIDKLTVRCCADSWLDILLESALCIENIYVLHFVSGHKIKNKTGQYTVLVFPAVVVIKGRETRAVIDGFYATVNLGRQRAPTTDLYVGTEFSGTDSEDYFNTGRSWAPARGEQGGQAPTLEKIRVGMAHPGNFSRGLKTSWQ